MNSVASKTLAGGLSTCDELSCESRLDDVENLVGKSNPTSCDEDLLNLSDLQEHEYAQIDEVVDLIAFFLTIG